MSQHSQSDVDAVATAVAEAVERLAVRLSQERPYAFCLMTLPDEAAAPALACAIATEEGLEEVVQRYLRLGWTSRTGEHLNAVRRLLRWANPDDGWRLELESFELVNKRLQNAAHIGDWFSLCVEAVRAVDRRGGFSSLGSRSRLAVGVSYGVDPSDFIHTVSELNPPELVTLVTSEWKDALKAITDVVAPRFSRPSK